MVEPLMSFEMYKSSLERTGAVVLSVWGKLGFCFYYWSFKSSHLFPFRVIAQVTCELQVPKSSRPSEGILSINLELNPMADPNFEAGRQSELSSQLNRLLEKCIINSKAVDLESLCVKMNERV